MEFPALLVITIYQCLLAYGQKIIVPIAKETTLYADANRWMQLSESDSRAMAAMISKKNFSILIEFKQSEYSRGSLFAVYAGDSLVLEVTSDARDNSLKFMWRRGSTVSTKSLIGLDFDDDNYHRVIFELKGPMVYVTRDCVPHMIQAFPELEFGILNRVPPIVWIGQSNATEKYFFGKIRTFQIQEGSFNTEVCNLNFRSQAPDEAGLALLNSETLDLRRKVHYLESQVSRLTAVVENLNRNLVLREQSRNPDFGSTPAPHPTTGVCPDCYEYLRHKSNYLETEFKKLRDTVDKTDANMKHVVLVQRGCLTTYGNYKDGETFTRNCTICVCHAGKMHCHPQGCRQLNCSMAVRKPGQCCPTCGQSCYYMQKFYEHGQIFYPKSCVRCRCLDGETFCDYETQTTCPPLSCSKNETISLENRCCPVCMSSDFCASRPCHLHAKCLNKKHGHECTCLPGFFGDGEHHCFDVDECSISQRSLQDNERNNNAVTVDEPGHAGPCGLGGRCINTAGSYLCECLPGFTKIDEKTCVDHVGHAP